MDIGISEFRLLIGVFQFKRPKFKKIKVSSPQHKKVRYQSVLTLLCLILQLLLNLSYYSQGNFKSLTSGLARPGPVQVTVCSTQYFNSDKTTRFSTFKQLEQKYPVRGINWPFSNSSNKLAHALSGNRRNTGYKL